MGLELCCFWNPSCDPPPPGGPGWDGPGFEEVMVDMAALALDMEVMVDMGVMVITVDIMGRCRAHEL